MANLGVLGTRGQTPAARPATSSGVASPRDGVIQSQPAAAHSMTIPIPIKGQRDMGFSSPQLCCACLSRTELVEGSVEAPPFDRLRVRVTLTVLRYASVSFLT
jgi:hypothetical protein